MKRHAKRRIKKPSTRSQLPAVIRPINPLPSLLMGQIPKAEVNVSALIRYVQNNEGAQVALLSALAGLSAYHLYKYYRRNV